MRCHRAHCDFIVMIPGTYARHSFYFINKTVDFNRVLIHLKNEHRSYMHFFYFRKKHRMFRFKYSMVVFYIELFRAYIKAQKWAYDTHESYLI